MFLAYHNSNLTEAAKKSGISRSCSNPKNMLRSQSFILNKGQIIFSLLAHLMW